MRRAHFPYAPFGRYGRGGPCKKTTSDDFKVTFDVKSFNPEEISVKVKGREILVDGKHDERADEHGFVSRQFTRRYVVPNEYDIDTVATYLDGEGKMTVKASKPKPVVDTSSERVIPIERVASVQEEIGEALAAVDLMDDETTDSKKDE
jgi:crystallin alpha B